MKPSLAQRIRELREENGWSQAHLAKLLGNNTRSSVCNYESEYSLPSGATIELLAQIFDVTVDYLLGETDLRERYIRFINGKRIPVFKCSDSDAIIKKEYSNIQCYVEIADCVNIRRGDFFGVYIDDNGMDKLHINKNDIAIITRRQVVESGSICAVIVDNHITVRKIYEEEDIITLVPESHDDFYKSKKYKKEDVNILGVVIKAIIDIPEV